MDLIPSMPAPPGMTGSAIPGQPTRYDDYGMAGGGFASAPPSLNASIRMRPFLDGRSGSIKAGDILFIQRQSKVDHNPECVALTTLEGVNFDLATESKKRRPEDGTMDGDEVMGFLGKYSFVGFAAADVDSGGPEDQSIAVTIEGMAQMRNVAVKLDIGTEPNPATLSKLDLYPGQAVYLMLTRAIGDGYQSKAKRLGGSAIDVKKGDFYLCVTTHLPVQDSEPVLPYMHIGTVMQGCASGSLSAKERGLVFDSASRIPHAGLAPKAMICCRPNCVVQLPADWK
jgi:hypothetical protein